MQEYRQCPCGQMVAMDLTVRQCPACGRPVDRTWRVVYPERTAPAAPAAAEVRQPLQQPQTTMPPIRQRVPVGADPVVQAAPGAGSVRRPITPAPEQTARPPAQSVQTAEPPVRNVQAAPAPKKPGAWQLDYFGQKLRIPPQDTVCLGRNSVGAEYFEGDMLVSRKHVYLWVNGAGQLLAEDRESLNGTFYTRSGQRSPLEHGISVRLQAGDILWLYDLPLKVEQCNDEKNGVDGIA